MLTYFERDSEDTKQQTMLELSDDMKLFLLDSDSWLHHVTNIKTLFITADKSDLQNDSIVRCVSVVTRCVTNKIELRRLEITIPSFHEDYRLEYLARLIDGVNLLFVKSKGKLSSVKVKTLKWGFVESWFWEKEDGGVLDFAREEVPEVMA